MELDNKDIPSTLLQEWYAKGSHLDIPSTASTRIWRQGTGPTLSSRSASASPRAKFSMSDYSYSSPRLRVAS